jgi:exonuclease VII small subunit
MSYEKAKAIGVAAGMGAASLFGAEQLGEHRGSESEKVAHVEKMEKSNQYLARLESFEPIIEQLGIDKVTNNRSLPWYAEAAAMAKDCESWLESPQATEIARRLVRICPNELISTKIREGILKLPEGTSITEELSRYVSLPKN